MRKDIFVEKLRATYLQEDFFPNPNTIGLKPISSSAYPNHDLKVVAIQQNGFLLARVRRYKAGVL